MYDRCVIRDRIDIISVTFKKINFETNNKARTT